MSKKLKKKSRSKKRINYWKISFISFTLLIILIPFVIINFQKKNSDLSNADEPLSLIVDLKKMVEPFLPVNIISNGSRDNHEIALTFDADMTPAMEMLLKKGIVKSWFNKDVYETLKRENVKATIFLTGLWVKNYPDEAKMIAKDPLFEIGNHSYSHFAFAPKCYNLPTINDNEDKKEIESAQKIIYDTTGVKPKFFRFPGGCHEKSDFEIVKNLGFGIVQWDVISGDSYSKNPDQIAKIVESRVKNGSIIVFHISGGPYAPETNKALLKIIPYLKSKGYKFVKISELIK